MDDALFVRVLDRADELLDLGLEVEPFGRGAVAVRATPALFEVTGKDWLANHALGEEVFGPLGLVVRARDEADLLALAAGVMLTATPKADAQTVVFDFDQYPIPASSNTTVFLPYDEEGLRLNSNKDVIIPALNNAGQYLGIKSFSPMAADRKSVV